MPLILLYEVRKITSYFIDILKELAGQEVILTADYYWSIGLGDENAADQEPPIMVGSLLDDWQALKKLLDKHHSAATLDLIRLANILEAFAAGKYKAHISRWWHMEKADPGLIYLDDVKKVADVMLVKAERAAFRAVDVPNSYWMLDREHIYTFNEQEPAPFIKNLEEDWLQLKTFFPGRQIPKAQDIEALVRIIKTLANTIHTSDKNLYVNWLIRIDEEDEVSLKLRDCIVKRRFAETIDFIEEISYETLEFVTFFLAYEEGNRAAYDYVSFLISDDAEVAILHELLADLLRLITPDSTDVWQRSFHHVRRAVQLEPETLAFKEYLLLYNLAACQLLSDAEAAPLAHELLAANPANASALALIKKSAK